MMLKGLKHSAMNIIFVIPLKSMNFVTVYHAMISHIHNNNKSIF